MNSDGRDMAAYWDARAAPFLGREDEWRGVSAGAAPAAIAQRVFRLEERGVRFLEAALPHGRVLDAGCGYGRWFSCVAPNRSVVGVDFSPTLIDRAKANRERIPVKLADVRDLPFADGEFDGAFTVKVLQFVPRVERADAIAELFRVVGSHGTVVLYEKIHGSDGHSPGEWTALGRAAGGRLVRWHGNHYALFERPLTHFARMIHDALQRSDRSGKASEEIAIRYRAPLLFRQYMRLYRAALTASMPIEPYAERFLPNRFGTHGIFHFEKESQ